MSKLYEIVGRINELEAVLEQMDENDDTFEVVKEYLDGVEVEKNEKVENILKFIKNLEAEADMYKSEKQRLEKLQKSANNKAENLKGYLAEMLKGLGYDHKNKKKIETSIGKVGFQKNPATIEIVDEQKALEKFSEYVKQQPVEFRKKDVLKWVKENVDLSSDEVLLEDLGVKYIDNSNHLRIR